MQQRSREPRIRINEKIFYNTEEVRVIGHLGEQLGVLRVQAALEHARSVGLDLVEVSPTTKPPVCKILDFGKYKYEEAKKAKSAKAKQHIVKLKEIKLHPRTDVNDYNYRLAQGKEFLAKGFKLKATIVFRGREMAHQEYGGRWLKQMETDLEGLAILESPAKQEGRNMSTVFTPIKNPAKKKFQKPAEGGEKKDGVAPAVAAVATVAIEAKKAEIIEEVPVNTAE